MGNPFPADRTGSASWPGAYLLSVCESATSNEVIAAQSGGDWGFLPHVWATLSATVEGCALGGAAGLAAALIGSLWPISRRVLEATVELTRVVPPLIFIPFAVLLSGSSRTVEVTSIGIYAALAVGLYSLGELIHVHPDHVALGKLLGAGPVQLLLTVRLPAILPRLIGPARVVISLALGIGVVAEFLAVPTGLGRVMKFALSYARVDLIMVAVLWSVLIILAIDLVLFVIAKVSFRWTESDGMRGNRS